AHLLGLGEDLDRLVEVHAPEHDAGVGGRRAQGHIDLLATMQADARGANDVPEGSLSDHCMGGLRGRSAQTAATIPHGVLNENLTMWSVSLFRNIGAQIWSIVP